MKFLFQIAYGEICAGVIPVFKYFFLKFKYKS